MSTERQYLAVQWLMQVLSSAGPEGHDQPYWVVVKRSLSGQYSLQTVASTGFFIELTVPARVMTYFYNVLMSGDCLTCCCCIIDFRVLVLCAISVHYTLFVC